jgi:hypothetical protein
MSELDGWSLSAVNTLSTETGTSQATAERREKKSTPDRNSDSVDFNQIKDSPSEVEECSINELDRSATEGPNSNSKVRRVPAFSVRCFQVCFA